MFNRFVIALNHDKVEGKEDKKAKLQSSEKLTVEEINCLMNFVRRYPNSIKDKNEMFTHGFSKN